MKTMAAKEDGVFRVDGEPSYNSCDEYINCLLAKVVTLLLPIVSSIAGLFSGGG